MASPRTAHSSPSRAERRAGGRLTLIALRFTLLLERVSRRLFEPPARPVIPRFARHADTRGLELDRPLHAALKPPDEFVFVPQDEYFDEVERLLESV